MRKLLAIICLLLGFSTYSLATAFGAGTAWDIRTVANSGADTNAGAFDPTVASPGTDESQGAGTAITCTLASSTTATCVPAISSTTHGPGNHIEFASGASCTVQNVAIISQVTGTATFNVAEGTTGNVCVGVIGGSKATIAAALALAVAGNTVHIQSGTYTQTATLTAGNAAVWDGYYSTHGDLDALAWTDWTTASGRFPVIATATNSTNLIKLSVNLTYTFANLSLKNTASTKAEGIYASLHTPTENLISVILDGFTKALDCDDGTNYDCVPKLWNVEIKNSTTYAIGVNGFPLEIHFSNIHDNPVANQQYWGVGTIGAGPIVIDHSILANNAFGTQLCCGSSFSMYSSLYYGTTSSVGVYLSTSSPAFISNSIFYANSGYGLDCLNSTGYLYFTTNAFGANSTNGSRRCAPAIGVASGAGATTTGVNGIVLTADPFVSSGTENFALNSTAGGGALLKAAGLSAMFPGGVTHAYFDLGPVQSQATAASSPAPYGYVY